MRREYFCQQRRYDFYQLGEACGRKRCGAAGDAKLAKELNVVLPISFYEQEVNTSLQFGSLHRCGRRHCRGCTGRHISRMIIIIRKSSILHRETPASGYLTPDTARSVMGICWDQWFPETATVYGSYEGAETAAFIRRRSAPNRFLNVTVCRTGAAACRDMQRCQSDAGDRGQPDRPGGSGTHVRKMADRRSALDFLRFLFYDG